MNFVFFHIFSLFKHKHSGSAECLFLWFSYPPTVYPLIPALNYKQIAGIQINPGSLFQNDITNTQTAS